MKKYILYLLLLSYSTTVCSAGKNTTVNKEAINQWLQTKNESGFLQNKGQMMDMDGKPVAFVLFKAEAPGINLWVTEQGITLQTLKIEEEHKDKAANKEESFSDREEEKARIKWERIDMELRGASIKKENIFTQNALQGHNNYFYPHCSDGIYDVKAFQKVTIEEVYPGIDWVWYNDPKKGYKYDFIVHSGADYKQITLLYKSKQPIIINKHGQLELYTNYGNVKENSPLSFYEEEEVATQFKINTQKRILINEEKGYETSIGFDLKLPVSWTGRQTSNLVIDPQLVWGTLYGGNSLDGFVAMDTDPSGNLFVTGYSASTNFPTDSLAGAFFQGTKAGIINDASILKFNNAGLRLWATYYGGSGGRNSFGNSITTDAAGNIFVTGSTESANFPTDSLPGAFFQGTNAGTPNFIGMLPSDAFILKFNNAGLRLWATYYGGNGIDVGNSITTDAAGNVFVTGTGNSTNFPTDSLAGAYFQGTSAGRTDAFILKFNNAGTRLWATYYGGSENDQGYSITTDPSGNIFVTGGTRSTNFPTDSLPGAFFQGTNAGIPDAFILKFNNAGLRLWATYYGGDGSDNGYSITTDAAGNVFALGQTVSSNLPTKNPFGGAYFQGANAGSSDAFILKFNNTGLLLWATYYGGSGNEVFKEYDGLAIDGCGKVYVAFSTQSGNIPTQVSCGNSSYIDTSYGGSQDEFIVQFDNSGNRLWASYIGGDTVDGRGILAIDTNDNLFMGGEFAFYTNSSDLPMANPGGGAYFDNTPNGEDDSYILKFIPSYDTATIASTVCDSYTSSSGNYIWTSSGTYTDTVITPCGCDTIYTINLTINSTTTSTDVQTACDSFTWIDSNTYTASTNTPTNTLVAANGCDSIVILNLQINCDFFVYLPNAFTPNGDGANDMLYIRGSEVENITIKIFDRWGNIVFESIDILNGWDGKTKGIPANQGVYAYVVYGNSLNGENINLKGNITLIR